MRITIVLYLLIAFTSVNAQNNEDSLQFGLYMRDKTKVLQRVTPSIVCDAKADFSVLAFERPSAVLYIDKPYSEHNRFRGAVDFLFFFVDPNSDHKMTPFDFKLMLKNKPFIYADSPQKFVLARLFQSKEKRALRIEKEKLLSGVRYRVYPTDIIPCTIIPIDNRSFLVTTEYPLTTGEYGFVYQGEEFSSETIGMSIYDFSIEKPILE